MSEWEYAPCGNHSTLMTGYCPDCRVAELTAKVEELEEDIRIANENLEKVEQWQAKMIEEYPIVAERINELMGY